MKGALIVGLNRVDSGRYGSPMPTLRCAERDAFEIERFARDRGFETGTPLIGGSATLEAVLAQLQWSARAFADRDDVFMFYFAGHGSQVPDPTWSERDGLNETFCLYDGELIDHALYVALSAFNRGVKVLVVTDCCHSGDEVLWESPRVSPPLNVVARTLPSAAATDAYTQLAASCNLQPRLRRGERAHILSADVQLIAACREEELAFEGPARGHFTDALLRVWEEKPGLSFDELVYEVDALTPDCQTPNSTPLSQPGLFTHMPF